MRKIMALLLVALLAFSIIVTFAACNDDGITKNDVEKGSSSESSSDNTTENKNGSETTSNTTSSETTKANSSETTKGETTTSAPSLSPEQEDKEGSNFNPMRPL